MQATVTLETERLTLRRLMRADVPVFTRLLDDLEVSRWLTVVPHPYTQADGDEFLDYLESAPFDGFGIFGPEGLAGVVGIGGWLGYWLGQPYWGRGYATEASTALIGHYFAKTDEESLGSGYFDGNEASRNVLTKLGFQPEGATDKICRATGEPVTLNQVRLTRAAWEARR